MGHLRQIVLFLALSVCGAALAETVELEFTNEAPRLPPDIKPNIWYLPGDNTFAMIEACHLPTADYKQYWQPSYQQVSIVDKKVVTALKDLSIDWKDDKLRKLYFGLSKDLHQKQVFMILFREKKENISSIIGYDELDCFRIEQIVRFDINKMETDVLSLFHPT